MLLVMLLVVKFGDFEEWKLRLVLPDHHITLINPPDPSSREAERQSSHQRHGGLAYARFGRDAALTWTTSAHLFL